MSDPALVLFGIPLTLGELIAGGLGLVLAGLCLLCLVTLRAARTGRELEENAQAQAREMEARLASLAKAQNEVTGRVQTMAEVFGTRQSELTRALSDRLDGMTHRLGQNMAETTKSTHESLSKLHERLAVIDKAQANITDLSGRVVELQHILANKQTRGAFGQGRMEAIVQDGLPAGGFTFQATLSTGTRPDCLVHLPNGAPSLVIDAKFPLEAFTRIRDAETAEARKHADAQFRRDVGKHVDDIRQRYFVPGETQDTAFLFVPSESIFAELNERFEEVVQRAHRARVVVVSPSLLLLSIQVVQSVLRDARLKEQAHLIHREVTELVADVDRLGERVQKLQTHFAQANKDIDTILVSTGKIAKRGAKIEDLDLAEPEEPRVAALRVADG